MVDFDPIYLKVQIPHFSENFWLKQKFWMGGPTRPPPPISENVPYGRQPEIEEGGELVALPGPHSQTRILCRLESFVLGYKALQKALKGVEKG